jgi:hypothetical protein
LYYVAREAFNNKNFSESLSHATIGHNKNYIECSNLLALQYILGYGVEKDLYKALEILSIYADKGDDVVEYNLAGLHFELLEFKKAVGRARKVNSRSLPKDTIYPHVVSIYGLVLGDSTITDLLRLKNKQALDEFELYDIEIINIDYNSKQKNILKFDNNQRLVAAQITIEKFEDWVDLDILAIIISNLYQQVDKKENLFVYKIGNYRVSLLNILAENSIQITYGDF